MSGLTISTRVSQQLKASVRGVVEVVEAKERASDQFLACTVDPALLQIALVDDRGKITPKGDQHRDAATRCS